MKKLDRNQKIGLVFLALFIAFLIVFYVLSALVQNEIIPDITPSQRFQGILAFFMCLPLIIAMFFLIIAMFFAGRHFKSKGSKIGSVLNFVSIMLFVCGILQAILSLLGTYGT